MAAKVTFVNKLNKAQTFKVNLFGEEQNRVRVSSLLAGFKASVAIMSDGSIMEADDDGLSMDTFKAGSMHSIRIIPAHQESTQETLHPSLEEQQPGVVPLRPWATIDGEVRTITNLNMSSPAVKRKPIKKARKVGPPTPAPDPGGLETVEPSSHIEMLQQHTNRAQQQPAEVGDMVAFLEGPSGQGSEMSKGDTPPPHGESEEDVAGSTPCVDQGKAAKGHIRCIKCGHSKNPSAKLQCGHCGALLREQTRARVAQRWAMLREKAKREGRLGDKAWQKRKKGAFDKLSDITMLDLENTYFALFMARRNREGDNFSHDGWYSEGAGREFVTTSDVKAIWKSFVKKHHKRKDCITDAVCDGVGDHGVAQLEAHPHPPPLQLQ